MITSPIKTIPANPSSPSWKERVFPQLTGVRAIAAYLVFLYHYNIFGKGTFFYKINNELQIGVTIFFVLSGFLIYYRYSETKVINWSWFGRYYKNRFARIYPVYFLMLTVAFCVYGWPHLHTIFLNYTLTKGLVEDERYSGITQAWSLTVEECFYLTAPLYFLAGRKKWGLPLALICLLASGLAISILPLPFNIYQGHYRFIFLYTFLGRATEFFMGIYLARLILRKGTQRSGRLKHISFTYLSMVGLVGLILFMTTLATDQDDAGMYHPLGTVLNNVVFPLFISGWFYGLLTEQTLLKRLLASKLFILLGASSYAFYLIHVGALGDFLNHHLSDNVLFKFLVLNVVAIGIYRLVEVPCNRFIKQLRLNQPVERSNVQA